MSPPALELRQVTVSYQPGQPPTLTDVSLALRPGERVALFGLNGSGKTTLLTATVGLVQHQGEIRVAGERLTPRTAAAIRERIGFLFNVPEDQLLFPTALEDTSFGPLRRGAAPAEAAAQARRALGELGVGPLADAPLHVLSHGQKLRVALAGALVTGPSLLLLDEPSSGLDPPGRRALAATLGRLDAAMLIATHDLAFAAGVCTRFLVLEGGRISVDGADLSEVERRWAPP